MCLIYTNYFLHRNIITYIMNLINRNKNNERQFEFERYMT